MQLGLAALLIPSLAALPGNPPDAGQPPSRAEVAAIWGAQRTPAPGTAQAIGACSAGCLQGAEALPPSGPGYEVLHLSRRRNFGHPGMVAFIRRLAKTVQQKKLGVLVVGDLSQVRGGPTPSGHRSHQSGLDADLAYAEPAGLRPGHVTAGDRERLSVPVVVNLRTHTMTSTWTKKTVALLEAAASDPAVDRIFVNPAIKRELCSGPARGAAWLARLRPWWGHHDHFHVRLKCPDGGALCQVQDPPAVRADDPDGCGASLAWWFSEEASTTQQQRAGGEPGITLPAECTALLGATGSQPTAERTRDESPPPP